MLCPWTVRGLSAHGLRTAGHLPGRGRPGRSPCDPRMPRARPAHGPPPVAGQRQRN